MLFNTTPRWEERTTQGPACKGRGWGVSGLAECCCWWVEAAGACGWLWESGSSKGGDRERDSNSTRRCHRRLRARHPRALPAAGTGLSACCGCCNAQQFATAGQRGGSRQAKTGGRVPAANPAPPPATPRGREGCAVAARAHPHPSSAASRSTAPPQNPQPKGAGDWRPLQTKPSPSVHPHARRAGGRPAQKRAVWPLSVGAHQQPQQQQAPLAAPHAAAAPGGSAGGAICAPFAWEPCRVQERQRTKSRGSGAASWTSGWGLLGLFKGTTRESAGLNRWQQQGAGRGGESGELAGQPAGGGG